MLSTNNSELAGDLIRKVFNSLNNESVDRSIWNDVSSDVLSRQRTVTAIPDDAVTANSVGDNNPVGFGVEVEVGFDVGVIEKVTTDVGEGK